MARLGRSQPFKPLIGKPIVTVAGGTQTLTASLFTNSNSFFTHTLNRGVRTLTASLFTNSNSFYTHVLNRGTRTLLPTLFSNSNTFYSHTLNRGTVTLTAALYSNPNAFYTHTIVVTAPQTLTASLFTNTNTFYQHAIPGVGAASYGGAGHPTGIYWGVRKHKKFTKTIDWLLDRVVSEYYAELTAPDVPEAVKKQAEKIVKPYKEQGKAVNWAKFETDIDRVIRLLELYQREHDLQEDEEKWMMLD